jgi:hypothetical protein
MTEVLPKPRPGWRIILAGDEFDLEDWRHSLNEPFDPVAELLPDGKTVLRSKDFDDLLEAGEVRARGLVLVARMNGAISIWNGARPVRVGGVLRLDEGGRQHAWAFGEGMAIETRCKVRATAVVLGPDGNPKPASPPEASPPQKWNLVAERSDDASYLLDHFGRADNWYDIYKTLEFAEHLMCGEHKLAKLLGENAKQKKDLKASANFFRHAKAHRPLKLLTLAEAKPLLANIVSAVLNAKSVQSG